MRELYRRTKLFVLGGLTVALLVVYWIDNAFYTRLAIQLFISYGGIHVLFGGDPTESVERIYSRSLIAKGFLIWWNVPFVSILFGIAVGDISEANFDFSVYFIVSAALTFIIFGMGVFWILRRDGAEKLSYFSDSLKPRQIKIVAAVGAVVQLISLWRWSYIVVSSYTINYKVFANYFD